MLTTTLRIFGLGLLLLPGLLQAQVGRVRVEENVRAEPNGVLLGRLREGALLQLDETQGEWARFTLEGWVWARSLRVIDRAGFGLTVAADGGENIREAPSGTILGRLEEGTLLDELERVPGWIRVRRSMWIWRPSLDGVEDAPMPVVSSTAPAGDRFRTVGRSGLPVLTSPDGDTLSLVRPGSDVEVLAREGNWARVRVEGWSWLPTAGDSPGTEEAEVLRVSPDEVSAAPGEHRGRLVEWDLQFVSLERAEKIRTDFYEGEPFLLTRTLDGDPATFVYVAVPPERLSDMEGLTPLQRVRVLGRIRTGAASLTGSPIVDLLELRAAGGA